MGQLSQQPDGDLETDVRRYDRNHHGAPIVLSSHTCFGAPRLRIRTEMIATRRYQNTDLRTHKVAYVIYISWVTFASTQVRVTGPICSVRRNG